MQTLTRVNRPYENFRYGYVVDFADIKKEFDKTNQAYWKELQADWGGDITGYEKLFKSANEIEKDNLGDDLPRFVEQLKGRFYIRAGNCLGRQKPLKILTVVCTRLKNCADFLSNGRMSVNKAQPNKPSRLLVYGF